MKTCISAFFLLCCGLASALWAPPAWADGAAEGWRGKRLVIPLGPATSGSPLPLVKGPAGRPLVVIDAGHGGHDPGTQAVGDGLAEKTLTLTVARKLAKALRASGRVRVALTRDADHFLVLRERTAIARNLNASLFISIHADSAGETASGASIYTLSEIASDKEAEALAGRENKADILNGINLARADADVTPILVDLAQRETMAASRAFAELVRRAATGQVPFRTEGLRMAGLAVLKAPDMPAILIELGYLSNPQDAARIRSAAGQDALIAAVRRATEIYFARQTVRR